MTFHGVLHVARAMDKDGCPALVIKTEDNETHTFLVERPEVEPFIETTEELRDL